MPKPVEDLTDCRLSVVFEQLLGDAPAEPELLDEAPLNSVCGLAAYDAIRAGEALLEQVRPVVGDMYDEQVASIVEHTIAVIYRG